MQSPLIELISNWEKYAAESAKPTAEEFCRSYLKDRELKCNCDDLPQDALTKETDMSLIKLISRISSAFNLYTRCALQNTNLENYEGFPFLNALHHLGETRKTEIITYNLTEMSTGIDILNRLLKQGLIEERQDPDDKRSKLLKLTPKGLSIWEECHEKVSIAASILFKDLTADEKNSCISTLNPVEEKHSVLAVECKGLCITEVEKKVK